MELRDYLSILRKYWVSIVLFMLAGLALAAGASLLMSPTYTAQTAVFVSVRGGDTAGELQAGANYASTQVRSYAQVATSPLVLQPVIDAKRLNVSAIDLAKNITATIPTNTAIIQISVTDHDPQLAAIIAQAVSDSLLNVIRTTLSPPDPTSGAQAVNATIITPATVPEKWTTPNIPLNLALGLIVGLALGVGQALLRHALDLTIRTDEDVARATDHSVITKVPYDPDAVQNPLIMQIDPHSPRAESYRRLRTNLQFLDAGLGRRRRRFVITSSIAGEGKSVTAINIATTLAESGDSVLLIDADLRLPKVATYLDLDNSVGLTTVLIGRAQFDDVVQPVGRSGLHVLTCGQTPPNPTELLGSRSMQALLDKVAQRYDTVILDAAPLLPVTDTMILSALADGTLIVAASGTVTVPQLRDAIASLDKVNSATLGVILNKTRLTGKQSYYYYTYGGENTNSTQAPPDQRKRQPNPRRGL